MSGCFKYLCCGCYEDSPSYGRLDQCPVHLPHIGLLAENFVDDIKMMCFSGPKMLIITKSYEVYGLGPLPDSEMYANIFEPRRLNQLDEKKIKKFVFGENFVLALTEKGEMFSWGENNDCRLGFGHSKKIGVPTMIPPFADKRVIDVACGSQHVTVLCKDQKIYSWGKCAKYQYTSPTLMATNAVGIACSMHASFYLTSKGEVFGSGTLAEIRLDSSNLRYQFEEVNRDKNPGGVSGWVQTGVWVKLPFKNKIKKIACGKHHLVALDNEGVVHAWGCNQNGQLGGQDSTYSPREPIKVSIINEKIIDIAADSQSILSAALSRRSKIYVWGGYKGGTFSQPCVTSFRSFQEVFTNLSDPNLSLGFITFKPAEQNRSLKTGALESIFDEKDDSDLIINVRNQNIYVHKIILKARSKYFQAMFTNQWKENDNNVLKVDDYSYETYRNFLLYLYTGEIDITSENVFELMSIADRYVDEDLSEMIVKKIETGSLNGEVIDALKEIMKLSSPNYEKFCEGMKKMIVPSTSQQDA
ncbi:RCC1 and BTB domain-containing protein 1-like [Planococcus citri]|uniref:RCC1 and BTB domain-containing protein 1-like n=1 Tax=Planococcus citri TaxID=170843 RepID=UPI0031F74C7A